ncbi:unnamed protein product, partial [Polarella glacialis]
VTSCAGKPRVLADGLAKRCLWALLCSPGSGRHGMGMARKLWRASRSHLADAWRVLRSNLPPVSFLLHVSRDAVSMLGGHLQRRQGLLCLSFDRGPEAATLGAQ